VDSGRDRAADRRHLAGLLVEVARCVDRDVAGEIPVRPDVDPRLAAVRHILFDEERRAIARLQEKLDTPEQLAVAVEAATQASIRKDARTFIDILYPLMGPTIRKSIAETLDGTLQSLNRALKHSVSWQGLKWRLEAYRSGTSFAEVVLKHTVVYRVEHVFLIHRKTGLLIDHVAAERAAAKDPQLVSGMLSAIQDFVRDSFSERGEAGLDALRLGDLVLWCEEGPSALLAAVIRGSPPEQLHTLLRSALVGIHAEWGRELADFDGDDTPLALVGERLRECLHEQEQTRAVGTSPFMWLVPLALCALAALAIYRSHRARWQIEDYVRLLRAEPGIVVTGFEKRAGVWHVTGLRDPLSANPQDVLAGSDARGMNPVGHWGSYYALDPTLALRRFQMSLDPPGSVSLAVDGGTVRARGTAPHPWIERARAMGRTLPPGSPGLDLAQVEDPELAEYERLRAAVESYVIHFDHNVPKPAAGQEATMDALAADLGALTEVARRMRVAARVTVAGHADSTGKDTPNLALSLGRAEVVRSMLRTRGVDPDLLGVRGAGPLEPMRPEETNDDRSFNRRVSFTVRIQE
jgi:OOP family OmpA-OmpF porin